MTILSYDDARQLFSGCIVETQGKLGFVCDVIASEDGDEPHKLAIKFAGARTNVLVPADPDEVYCPSHPYRLGYVQYTSEHARYLSRNPRRQYSIGWSESNVSGLNWSAAKAMGARLTENLMGNYPSFSEAVDLSKRNDGTIAFDRMFAVSDTGRVLQYKGSGVVYLTDVDNLADHGYPHLQELFNKARG